MALAVRLLLPGADAHDAVPVGEAIAGEAAFHRADEDFLPACARVLAQGIQVSRRKLVEEGGQRRLREHDDPRGTLHHLGKVIAQGLGPDIVAPLEVLRDVALQERHGNGRARRLRPRDEAQRATGRQERDEGAREHRAASRPGRARRECGQECRGHRGGERNAVRPEHRGVPGQGTRGHLRVPDGVVFAVENNQYAMGTSVKRSSAETHFYRRGTAFRIPGMQVNGMDVLEVHQAGKVAFDHVRAGKGPVLLELETYRYRGHSMSDPAKYRTREEVQDVREHNDPIERAKHDLEGMGVSEDQLKDLEKAIRAKVAEAADFAENSPEPPPAELYTDVLVGSY